MGHLLAEPPRTTSILPHDRQRHPAPVPALVRAARHLPPPPPQLPQRVRRQHLDLLFAQLRLPPLDLRLEVAAVLEQAGEQLLFGDAPLDALALHVDEPPPVPGEDGDVRPLAL